MAENAARVVVGYDGSSDADLALAWAADAAGPLDRPIEVVVVATAMDPVIGDFRARSDETAEQRRTQAFDRLKELGVTHGSVEVRHGPAGPELVKASDDARLLVVGSRGHGPTGALTGSVSQQVARHAHCPLVVVRACRSPHARRIVVGVDGSAASDRALRFAADRARATGETVVAVHGHHTLQDRIVGLDGAASESDLDRLAEIDRFVAELTAGVAADFPDVEIEGEAIAVRPDRLLVDCSTAASLVVVGSRGRDAVTELFLGSVSQHVLQHAGCPVAIVR